MTTRGYKTKNNDDLLFYKLIKKEEANEKERELKLKKDLELKAIQRLEAQTLRLVQRQTMVVSLAYKLLMVCTIGLFSLNYAFWMFEFLFGTESMMTSIFLFLKESNTFVWLLVVIELPLIYYSEYLTKKITKVN